jgi:hypothetical protein
LRLRSFVRVLDLKQLLVGSPLPTAQFRHERLGKASGLAVLASDALSSVAYATEEILLVLVLAGTAALSYSLPIGIAIAILVAIVTTSYRQTILAYPQGVGAYIVAKDNLGTLPVLVAGAALLIDYGLRQRGGGDRSRDLGGARAVFLPRHTVRAGGDRRRGGELARRA